MESAAATSHRNDLSDAQTRSASIDDEGRDFRFGTVVKMRGEDREQIRHRRIGYVALGAIEEVRIAAPDGGSLQRGRIRARTFAARLLPGGMAIRSGAATPCRRCRDGQAHGF
jgi:hypothetical protein